MSTSRELTALPNRDLWRGHVRVPESERNRGKITTPEMGSAPTPELAPIDKMMNAVKAAAGTGAAALNCLWCGQQFSDLGMREHIKTNHKSILDPAPAATLAMRDLALATPIKAESQE